MRCSTSEALGLGSWRSRFRVQGPWRNQMNLFEDWVRSETRRQFLTRGKNALGTAALATLLGGSNSLFGEENKGLPKPHFAAKAKQIIYLHMVGGPAQMDLF